MGEEGEHIAPPPAPEAAPAEPRVASYSLKIPPFWSVDPHLWFLQVEGQFRLRGIVQQETKYDHIMANLQPEIAMEVRDLIVNLPRENPYDAIKAALIKRTTASEQRRIQQLLNAEELGDRKPTQLLRRMYQLLGDKAGDMDASFLREMFLQRLPNHVRMILAATTDKMTMEDMAQMADKVMEVTSPSISNVTVSQPTSEVAQNSYRIAQLEKELSSLRATQRSGRRRNTSRSRDSRRTRSRSPSPSGVCWYHRRFGDSARKCTPPCSMQGNERAGK